MFKHLRDSASIRAMKQTCVIVILAYGPGCEKTCLGGLRTTQAQTTDQCL